MSDNLLSSASIAELVRAVATQQAHQSASSSASASSTTAAAAAAANGEAHLPSVPQRVDNDVEKLLVDIAEDFVQSVAVAACDLASHRGSKTLDVQDVKFCLEKHHGIRVPGFASAQVSMSGVTPQASAHRRRLGLVNNAARRRSKQSRKNKD